MHGWHGGWATGTTQEKIQVRDSDKKNVSFKIENLLQSNLFWQTENDNTGKCDLLINKRTILI